MTQTPITRRAALGRVTAATFGVAVAVKHAAGAALAQIPTTTPPPADPRFPQVPAWKNELRELAPGVFAYMQAGGPGLLAQGVSNAGVIVGDDGLMVYRFVTFAPLHAKAIISAIRKVTDKPFRHLINTHHHGDHVNGNQYCAPEIIGHPYCRDEVLKAVAGPPACGRSAKGGPTAPKSGASCRRRPRSSKSNYRYGKTIVEVFPMLPAHAYGDLVVYLPQHKILFVGDIGFFYVAPFCQNAHPSNWINVVDQISARWKWT